MSLFDTLALFVAMTALALVPSTSVGLVVARSSMAGFWNGAAVATGIVVGDLVFVCLAVLGMTALAEVMGGLFLLLKYVAGVYLIWLGVGLLRSKSAVVTVNPTVAASGLSTSFLSGLFVTLGDVKAIFFYASLFPAFVDLALISATDVAVIVVVTLIAVGGVKLGYAYAARRVVSLAGGFGASREIKLAAGCFMVGAGTYLMVKA